MCTDPCLVFFWSSVRFIHLVLVFFNASIYTNCKLALVSTMRGLHHHNNTNTLNAYTKLCELSFGVYNNTISFTIFDTSCHSVKRPNIVFIKQHRGSPEYRLNVARILRASSSSVTIYIWVDCRPPPPHLYTHIWAYIWMFVFLAETVVYNFTGYEGIFWPPQLSVWRWLPNAPDVICLRDHFDRIFD